MQSCMRPWFNALKNQIRAGLGTRDGYSKSYKPKPELHQHLFIRAVRTIEGRVGGPIVHPANCSPSLADMCNHWTAASA